MIDAQTKQESLENCIRLIHGQSDLPAFSHHLAELRKATGDEGATLNLLTNVILKNVSLTARVLRVANSIQYNPRGKPILSVSRAVTMMGWDSISHLAAGVLVFEHFRNKSDKLKELVLLMMLSANHARQISIRTGLRDVEEAYLCGLFRNLGELVLACYLPAEYAQVAGEMTNLTEAEACERVLRFQYEDLGKAMAHRWNLPDTVAHCMDGPDFSPPQSDLERMRGIISFSHALSAAVYRKDRSECEAALKGLIRKYGRALPVKESEIPAILEAAAFETEDTFRAAGLPMDRASLGRRILAATGLTEKASAGADQLAPQVEASPDILASLVAELRAVLSSGEDFDLNAALMMMLEAIYRGAGLDRVLFCLVDGERAWVQARLGVGADVEPLIDKFRFPVSIRSGPIASALLGKEDVILDAGAGACYRRSAFMQVVGTTCFGVLPLIVNDAAVGCLYFDSATESFALDPRARQGILELRELAVQALVRKRPPAR